MAYKPLISKSLLDHSSFEESAIFLYKELLCSDFGEAYDNACANNDRDFSVVETLSVKESVHIDRFNFRSFLGEPLTTPFRTVLWYGRRIYFKDMIEFAEFLDQCFTSRANEVCPICGKIRGRHLKFCFTQAAGLPFEIFPCSKACMQELTHNINTYREILSELKELPEHKEYPYLAK